MNKKVVIGGLIGCGALILISVVAVIAFLYWVGSEGPETRIVSGHEVKREYVETMRGLGLLEDGERIDLFYSDAIVDITEGMYVLTDRKVFLYNSSWAEPAIRVAFDEIADVNLSRDESFLFDSTIYCALRDGSSVSFPVSSEGDMDVQFYDKLRAKSTAP